MKSLDKRLLKNSLTIHNRVERGELRMALPSQLFPEDKTFRLLFSV